MLVLRVRDGDLYRVIKYHSDTVPIWNGGTGAITPEEARYNLGLAPATVATSMEAGLMSPEDKRKLDELSSGGGVTGDVATPDSDGLMSSADKRKLDELTTEVATSTSNGLMSSEDKEKLDSLSEAGANMDYSSSYNKPSIEGVILEGDVGLEELGIEEATEADISEIFS